MKIREVEKQEIPEGAFIFLDHQRVRSQVGTAIRQVRQEIGLNLGEAARKLNVPVSTLSSIELGRNFEIESKTPVLDFIREMNS